MSLSPRVAVLIKKNWDIVDFNRRTLQLDIIVSYIKINTIVNSTNVTEMTRQQGSHAIIRSCLSACSDMVLIV